MTHTAKILNASNLDVGFIIPNRKKIYIYIYHRQTRYDNERNFPFSLLFIWFCLKYRTRIANKNNAVALRALPKGKGYSREALQSLV